MAEELRIGSAHVKERSPLGVWLLIVVTLGIYGLVHWYKINREMRDYSQERASRWATTRRSASSRSSPAGSSSCPPSGPG